MQQVKVKNKVFSELQKLALRKDLQLSQAIELLLKKRGKIEFNFTGDFDSLQQRLYCLGIISILLPQLGTEDLRELIINFQERYPQFFDQILPSENEQNQEKNQEQNEL